MKSLYACKGLSTQSMCERWGTGTSEWIFVQSCGIIILCVRFSNANKHPAQACQHLVLRSGHAKAAFKKQKDAIEAIQKRIYQRFGQTYKPDGKDLLRL